MTPSCLSLLCFMVFGPPSLGLEAGTALTSRAPGTSVQAFGRANACASWGDGCTVCTRAGDGPAACSTPGIACTPGPVACKAP